MIKGLNNMVINSSRTLGESLRNSIDNYIKMENLYLQDGKINSTENNNDTSNTVNKTVSNNNNTISKDLNNANNSNHKK